MPVNPWNQVLQPVAGGANAPPVPPGWQNPGAGLAGFTGMPPQAAAYLNSLAATRRAPAAAQGFQNFGAQGQLAGAGPAPPGGYSPAIYNSPNERGMLSDENFAQRMNAGVRPQDINLADLERYMFPNAPGMGVATEATPMPGVPADLYLSNPGHFQQYRDVSPMHEALPMMMRLGQMATQNQQANQQWQLGLGQLGIDTGRLGATVENQRAQNALGLAQEQRQRAELGLRMSPEARRGQAELMLTQGLASGTLQPQQLAYVNSTLRGQGMFQPFNLPLGPLPNIPGVSAGAAPGAGGSALNQALTAGPQSRGSANPAIGVQPDWNALRAAGINPAIQPTPTTAAQRERESRPPIGETGGAGAGQAPGADLPGQLMEAWNTASRNNGGTPIGANQRLPGNGERGPMNAAITDFLQSPAVRQALAQGNVGAVHQFLGNSVGGTHVTNFLRTNFSVHGRRTPHEEARDLYLDAADRASQARGVPSNWRAGTERTEFGMPLPGLGQPLPIPMPGDANTLLRDVRARAAARAAGQ